MAQRTITTLYSDLSGTEIEDGAGGTIRFALDGDNYEVDLTDAETEDLRGALAAYVAAARKVPRRGAPRASRPAPSSDPSAKEIRAWALENGHDVPSALRA